MIKFLCKELWTLVFRKQIDNLKTNHRVSVNLRRGLARGRKKEGGGAVLRQGKHSADAKCDLDTDVARDIR